MTTYFYLLIFLRQTIVDIMSHLCVLYFLFR